MKIPKIKTILYATDMGDHMRPVFLHAISLARCYDANIIMLHVVEPIGSTGQAVLAAYLPQKKLKNLEKNGMKNILKTMKKRLDDFCEDEKEICKEAGDLVTQTVVSSGRVGDEIPHQAKKLNADIIIMGTGTSNFPGSSLLGSNARHVTQFSSIPVLVVPNL